MKYLLDTDVIVNHLRGKRAVNISWLEDGSGTSLITQAELFYGAYKSSKPQDNLKKVKQMLADLSIKTLSLDTDIAQEYGKIKASLEEKGQRLDEFDLLIAATARVHNLSLVTGNIKHFARIKNLKIVSC